MLDVFSSATDILTILKRMEDNSKRSVYLLEKILAFLDSVSEEEKDERNK